MKKVLICIVFFSSLFIFSACSFFPSPPVKNEKNDFLLSQSLWKTSDGGKNWEVKNKGQGKPNGTNVEVLSLAVNPFDGNHLYAGLRQGGILETKDGGENWSFINYQSQKVYGLSLDRVSGKTLFASGIWEKRGKMFRTEDGGENWKEIYTSPNDGPLVISLAVSKSNANVLYISTSDKEVLKSEDKGETWKNIYLGEAPVLKVEADSQDSNLIYLITSSGLIMRSSDGGKNFESLNEKNWENFMSYGGNQFSLLRADPSVSGRLYAAGTGGLFVSNDKGENWQKINVLNNPQNFPIRALAINPKNSQEIIYGAARATYKSDDGGKTWSTSQFDNGMLVNVLEYSSTDSNIIYLGFVKK